jgi:hypothetical protein
MAWPDDLINEITAYAETLGIRSPEVDVSNHWRAGQGTVLIQTSPEYGGSWASQDYRLPRSSSREAVDPIILRAGKNAAEHLVQVAATKH